MIDSGATGNFVYPETAEYRNFKTQKKRRPYRLGLIDGTNTISEEGWVTTETLPLRMKINDYEEWIQFDVTYLGSHELILGIPWLLRYNPKVN